MFDVYCKISIFFLVVLNIDMIPHMIPQIIVKKIMTDAEMTTKEGEYFNQSHYKPENIIRTDCDVYKDFIHEDNLLLKFRKGVISN